MMDGDTDIEIAEVDEAEQGLTSDEMMEPLLPDKKEVKKGKRKGKKKKNTMPHDIGTTMQSERTFMKWVWLGFHIGAIGTFILAFFAKSQYPVAEVLLVLATWVIAFSFVLFGTVNFYRRRRALAKGLSDRFFWDNRWGPYAAVGAIVFEILMVVVFAWYTGTS
ncbi:hypothetical protein NDN08_006163 [Rhodosorus marinus]|uniref:DUF202 domain-containing protein n=1 Tax=Rhodosorus marinus TaxID=101924 RepID=A0AAV8UP27_9RHOD|nr:hypothetical protein NDN08_006163 [Rhodosorus marinus]